MAENEAVLEKLDEMDGKLDKVVTWQAVHTKGHEALERDLKDARDTLYHNPVSLVDKVKNLWNGKKYRKSWREFFMAIGIRLVSWAAIGVIFFLLLLYKGH